MKDKYEIKEIISIKLRYMNWLLLKTIRLALGRKIKIKIDEVEWLWVKYVNDYIVTAIRLLSTMRTSLKVK